MNQKQREIVIAALQLGKNTMREECIRTECNKGAKCTELFEEALDIVRTCCTTQRRK